MGEEHLDRDGAAAGSETTRHLHTWSDEQYALVAAKTFEKAISGKTATLGYQLELGKWMLASLLLVNGGALAAIAASGAVAGKVFPASGPWFVAGMVAALLSGFAAWCNAAVAADVYDDIANPWMIVSREGWPMVPPSKGMAITLTTWASVGIGFISVVAFAIGVLRAGAALS